MSSAEPALKALMVASQAGDAAAHRRLLDALAGPLRAYFRRRLQEDGTLAEDLVQETLLAIHLKRGTWDPSQALEPWVYALARYKLVDQLRRARVRATVPLEDDAALFASEAADESPAARLDVDRLLATLPKAQANAIRLTKLDGLSVAEAAAATGASVSAIKVQVHRGLKRLAARFGLEG